MRILVKSLRFRHIDNWYKGEQLIVVLLFNYYCITKFDVHSIVTSVEHKFRKAYLHYVFRFCVQKIILSSNYNSSIDIDRWPLFECLVCREWWKYSKSKNLKKFANFRKFFLHFPKKFVIKKMCWVVQHIFGGYWYVRRRSKLQLD